MTTQILFLFVLAILWTLYFVVHSLLATLTIKQWLTIHWSALSAKYRGLYNGLALALLIPPLALTMLWDGPMLWSWNGIWAWAANGSAGVALLLFIWTLHYYDMQDFLGLRQWRLPVAPVQDQEQFHLSPLHRYVRHPWYSLGLIMIWTRNMDAAWLLTACMFTLYFIVGSHLEERKLLIYHGDVYRRYRQRVPGLVPLPWKTLSKQEAASLIQSARDYCSH